MIITQKEQFNLINDYQKKGHTLKEEVAFVDGLHAMTKLVDKKLTEEKQK